MFKLILFLLIPILCIAETKSVVYNVSTQQVLHGNTESPEVSIASISKLMTVYTVLEANQDLDEKLTVTSERLNHTKLNKGMVLSRRELINLSLVSSDNLAAVTLSENYPGGRSSFIRDMNTHATLLNMEHTRFSEPTGLSPMNFSSIADVIKLTMASSQYSIIQKAAQTQSNIISYFESIFSDKKKKKKQKPIREPIRKTLITSPTSKFFGKEGVITIKTGFTRAAGFCITMLVSSNNQLYNIVVLGAKTKQERENIIKNSLNLIYNADV